MESGDLVAKWINRTDLGDIAGSATSVRKDNKGTFRNKNGLSGPYRFMQWKFVAERMKECAALLRENGRMLEAQACSEKAGTIQNGVKKLPISF